ncbi:Putative hemolysin [Geoalkalibacter ferrihydriticus]|uniref:Putative hemolysin n=1 Tax=Geoalkalibacter ferrihydriticus TaxID=392333 RepID=A0A1G9U5I5_9BACT|nr:lysophospholipid acyltransferase family protein [Geoalkalibacter ferrihydriticus]SDM55148.1 Putative hemolysin [Geoalkalibacter ferrihydriticus]
MSRNAAAADIFRFRFKQKPLAQRALFPLQRGTEYLLALDKCRRMYAHLPEGPPENFCARALDALHVKLRVSPGDLARIPVRGPLIVVANHPFGAVEGLALLSLLQQVRPDICVLANSLLHRIPELRLSMIAVDLFGGFDGKHKNVGGLRKGLRQLAQGGVLVIFPAGEVSHLNLSRAAIDDPPWSQSLARLVRASSAPVLPVYFPGRNSLVFQVMGLIHPVLRTAMLPHELLNKRMRSLEVRIGFPIAFRRLHTMSNADMTDYLRSKTYLLRQRGQPVAARTQARPGESIRPPISAELLEKEVLAIPPAQCLFESGSYQVFCAASGQIPQVLLEIGRLRELTFRGVGEGTGRALDLDPFDAYYTHLFAWQRETREIIGAYRLGRSDEILAAAGPQGLYTNTLFRYRPEFFNELGPALELGRSFVQPKYQKSYNPLMLLWKGIGRFVAKNPQYAKLFGPVSISREYQPASRKWMVSTLVDAYSIPELARMVKARRPLRLKENRFGCKEINKMTSDFDEMELVVADLEADGKGVPVLLRQYLSLGGRYLAFNVDEDFSDVLDGLVLVDLRQTDRKTLERYCGRAGAAEFLALHEHRDLAEGF